MSESTLKPQPVDAFTDLDVGDADRLEFGLAAQFSGVTQRQIAADFGADVADLAALAGRMRGPVPRPMPRAAFVQSLESALDLAFDERPVPAAWWAPIASSRLGEFAVVGTLAGVLAVAAFLMGGGSFTPVATAVPTVAAATRTATPPQAVDRSSEDAPRLAYLPPAAATRPPTHSLLTP
jgi:hypothetical protein